MGSDLVLLHFDVAPIAYKAKSVLLLKRHGGVYSGFNAERMGQPHNFLEPGLPQ